MFNIFAQSFLTATRQTGQPSARQVTGRRAPKHRSADHRAAKPRLRAGGKIGQNQTSISGRRH